MDKTHSRRRLLEMGVWGLLGLIGSVVAGILGTAVVAPALARRNELWLEVGSLEKLTDQPQRFDVVFESRQGWLQQQRTEVVYAYRSSGGEPRVFSSVCTHLGCLVRWEPALKQFQCPCHGGVYDANGAVVSGPPPRALNKPVLRVEGDRVLMLKT